MLLLVQRNTTDSLYVAKFNRLQIDLHKLYLWRGWGAGEGYKIEKMQDGVKGRYMKNYQDDIEIIIRV